MMGSVSVRVQVRVFGGVDVVIDGRIVDLGHPRQRCVFAALVVQANQPVSADLLVDQTWDETPPRGRDTLYSYLSRIRAALAPAPGLGIVHDAQGYRLTVDETAVDLHRFRMLVTQARASTDDMIPLALLNQALALSEGEPFAGLTSPWLADLRDAVAMERHAAELDRTDLALRYGQHTNLVADLSIRVAEHPLDERLAGQYLLALCHTGRQADAITHYQRMRATLTEQLGCRPAPALQAIYQQILAGEQSNRPTPARPAPAPRQLPPAPAWFTGREPEIAGLMPAGETTVVISAIAGTGGIGKTWLALHWAYQHIDQFADGQLFVDLRGFTPGGEPVTPADAVRGFLGGLGVPPDRIPVDLDAQTALYQSIVAGKHMLIVLDNAADTAQVTPLLPDTDTCTVLITSRRQLSDLSARHIRLDVLAELEARELLAARLGVARVAAEAEAVESLLACCGGFPLALGIVVGRALMHPNLPLSVLAAELSDEADALAALATDEAAASLPAVLSWSTRALTANQGRVFALLGIAPGPDISLAAACSLTALPLAEIRTVLRQLADASLIQQHMPGRYRMHDLIRRYASETAHRDLTEDVREEALRRVVDCYTHTAYAAEIVLNPHPLTVRLDPPAAGVHIQSLSDVPSALAWFDTEHSVLLAVQRTAVDHARHRTVWQVAWTLDTFLSRRGLCHDRLVAWRAALDAAAHLPEPARTIAERIVGNVYADLGCLEEGIGHLHQALALAEEHHDPLQQAHTHQALAWVWTRTGGDDRTALEYTIRARDLYHTLDQPVYEASMLNSMGWFTAQLGDCDAARTYCQTALALHQDQHYDEGAAATLDSLGYIEHHSGCHNEAIGYYEQAVTLFRAIGSSFEVATSLDNLGHPHIAIGQYVQAWAVWSEALELFQEQRRDTDAARVQRQLDELNTTTSARE